MLSIINDVQSPFEKYADLAFTWPINASSRIKLRRNRNDRAETTPSVQDWFDT